jgi:hypothetical protein
MAGQMLLKVQVAVNSPLLAGLDRMRALGVHDDDRFAFRKSLAAVLRNRRPHCQNDGNSSGGGSQAVC